MKILIIGLILLLSAGCSDPVDKTPEVEKDAGVIDDMGTKKPDMNTVVDMKMSPDTGSDASTNSDSGLPEPKEPISNDVDILWVIDNSGSMCQEQERLAQNFEIFIDELVKSGEVNFHIGVTTTHMPEKDYPQEPLAKAGHLQSTPQPIPGFDRTCVNSVDENGAIVDGQYDPVRKSIEAAVKCMRTPDASLTAFTNEELRCAVDIQPDNCEIVGKCGGAGRRCQMSDLFPPSDSYRTIPKVLKASDYTSNNTLDVAQLKADFACMSMVGTRGHGIEKGLSAAVAATDISLTGGPLDQTDAPGYSAASANHGFIRKDARFALVFLTDENDCSHDGTLIEETSCGDDICEYVNREEDADTSPLIKLETLRSDLLRNLSVSKNRTVRDGEIFVASLNGTPDRYDGPAKTQCMPGEPSDITPTCANALGIANSGDRYIRFLQTFPEGQYFPNYDNPTQGWLCRSDFSPALTLIGELLEAPNAD